MGNISQNLTETQIARLNIPPELAVSQGTIPGMSYFSKFGASASVGTTISDVWLSGGVMSLLSSAETMNITSTGANATDDDGDPAGIGARTVKVLGLDNNYAEIEETVTMNGTSNVLTTNAFLRVYRMYVVSAGSAGSNRGVITATASTAGTVQAHIGIGDNQTLQCIYTVPAGKRWHITMATFSGDKSDNIQFDLRIRNEGEVFQLKNRVLIFEHAISLSVCGCYSIPAKSDVKIQALKLSAGTSYCTAELQGYMETL